MNGYTSFWVKKSLKANKKINILFMLIMLLSLILFNTGVIYQDSEDNYYINRNTVGEDILTGQVFSESYKVIEYVENSKIRHIERHLCCQLVGIGEEYQAISIEEEGRLSQVFNESGYQDLEKGQIILNSDLKEEIKEHCKFESSDGKEWLIIEKNGVRCQLEIVKEISFTNPYFLTGTHLILADGQTLGMLSRQFDTPIQYTAFFNLKSLSHDAVGNYFSKLNAHFDRQSIRVHSCQNRKDIGYSSKLFQSFNIMIMVIAAISFLFALIAMWSGVSLKMRRGSSDIAVMKKIGLRNTTIGTALTLELLILTCTAAVAAFFISYFFMWLVLDKINFMLDHGQIGLNIMLSWRLVVKILLSNTIAFFIICIPIWLKLWKTTPVSYESEKQYNAYVARSSAGFLRSSHFALAFSRLLLRREKKNNFFQILLVALPIVNIILLLMIDMRDIPQQSERIDLYFVAMWDFAILMSWMRSITCLIATGISIMLYYEIKQKELQTFYNIGVPLNVICNAYTLRNAVVLLAGILVAIGVSYLYYLYTYFSAKSFSIEVGYNFLAGAAGSFAYICAAVCIYAASDCLYRRRYDKKIKI